MRVAIGCDHGGLGLKIILKRHLKLKGHNVIDCGTKNSERTDYPVFGRLVASEVLSGNSDRGIVICGTGIGISNAANKNRGARVVLLNSLVGAEYAVNVLNANIIALGARVIGSELACMIVDKFLSLVYIEKKSNDFLIKKINNLI